MTKDTKSTKSIKLEDMLKDTSCYTYEVTMIVQILAPNKEVADLKLDQDGGYVSKRDVVFKDSTLLYKDGLDVKALLQKGGRGGTGLEETSVLIEKKDN
jgi:hypothetical protein